MYWQHRTAAHANVFVLYMIDSSAELTFCVVTCYFDPLIPHTLDIPCFLYQEFTILASISRP